MTAFPGAPKKATRRSTLSLVSKTLREAEDAWAISRSSSVNLAPAGLYGGRLIASRGAVGFRLDRYSIAPGVRITGTLTRNGQTLPLMFRGTVKVSGPKALAGKLRVVGTRLSGVLGSRPVSGRL